MHPAEANLHATPSHSWDDLDVLLAAIEHHQGRPYLADPAHCKTCAEVDRAARLARWQDQCPHDEVVSEHDVAGRLLVLHCQRCHLDGQLLAQALGRRAA